MASEQTSSSGATTLPLDVVARATREAQKDGVFAGLSAGLVGAIVGSRFFRFNRNTTIVCGIVTGVLSGYQFTRGFLSSKLARLEAERAAMSKDSVQQDSSFVESSS
ncbi:hypothetical protein K474DRAFT_1660339 [Panus rudis PR-1116 ss-1]|nr:hypothetical protein K474DRAFT_1660339 [Panus rudis PR-1116 ss-1]